MWIKKKKLKIVLQKSLLKRNNFQDGVFLKREINGLQTGEKKERAITEGTIEDVAKKEVTGTKSLSRGVMMELSDKQCDWMGNEFYPQ